jgi:GT2 family glycosyltransferase
MVKKFTGACMSFHSKAVRDLRFDENLPTTMEEDVDFCLRVPGMLVIAPRARLFHKRSIPGRSAQHHLKWEARTAQYLYRRHWNHNLYDCLCFGWLRVGHALMATVGCLRHGSWEPWRALLEGIAEGKRVSDLAGGRSSRV